MKTKRTSRNISPSSVRIPSVETMGGITNESWLKPHPNFRLKKILVPVDFSDRSRKALQYALGMAEEFQAELILVHVVQPYPIVTEMPGTMAELQAQLEKNAFSQLAKLNDSIKGVASRGLLQTGQPVHHILKVALEEDVDLIVVATHGRTGLAHVVLGSVAERIVRHAHCPVLVVREREHEFLVTQPDNPQIQ